MFSNDAKKLLKRFVKGIDTSIRLLEADENTKHITALQPVMDKNEIKDDMKKFVISVKSLNNLIKFSSKQSNGLMRYRLKFRILCDIDLGRQIIKGMNKISFNLNELTAIGMLNKHTKTKPVLRSLREIYLDHYHNLKEVSKLLLD